MPLYGVLDLSTWFSGVGSEAFAYNAIVLQLELLGIGNYITAQLPFQPLSICRQFANHCSYGTSMPSFSNYLNGKNRGDMKYVSDQLQLTHGNEFPTMLLLYLNRDANNHPSSCVRAIGC